MKKILCPTDFSGTADNAILYAANLAHKLGAQLNLFNVQSLGDLTPEEALFGKSINTEPATARLKQQCEEISGTFKISCYGDVVTSVTSVNEIIAEKAEGYDLIVMGTDGPDDIFQFFLGSNTYQVIKKSSVPLLLVPVSCQYADVKLIIYAFDYWRGNHFPIRQLLTLAKSVGCELIVLQIMEESYSHKAEIEMKEIQKMLLELYSDEISIRFDTVYTSNLVTSVHEYVLGKQASLLALCTEHHGFLQNVFHKSLVKAISARAAYPVFVFHA